MKFLYSVMMFLVFCANLSASIVECQRLREILPLVEDDTLVVFNINNVLTVSSQDAGSTPWAEENINRLIVEKKIPKPHATNLFIPLWHEILVVTDVELFDPDAEAIVRYLQDNGIKTMALTNRYTEMAYSTHRNLRSVGIDFAKNPPFPEDCPIDKADSPSKYIEGIIFNGLINIKGNTLAAFLKQIGYTPKKIIYIEDKAKHLAQVEQSIAALGIPFIGVHFGALELQRESYRADLAEIQVKFHQDILDDLSAQKICYSNREIPKTIKISTSEQKSPLPQNIHVIHSIQELYPKIAEKALLVTELDHVLWNTQGSIGARPFFDYHLNKQLLLGHSFEEARKNTERLVEKIHRRAQVELIEEESISFFNELKEKNCWSVAISYRPDSLLQRTIEQAQNLKLRFNSPFTTEYCFQNRGIICAKGSQGQFVELGKKLSTLDTLPTKLIGLSSTLSDLLNLQELAKAKNIPYQGYWLNPLSPQEFILDDEVLNLQQECLNRLLTNEEAKNIVKDM